MIIQPAFPNYGSGQVVTPAAASAAAVIREQSKQVVLTNIGAGICYVRTYSSLDAASNAATTADYPVLPNSQATITKDMAHNRIAHISAAGTTLHIMTAEGF